MSKTRNNYNSITGLPNTQISILQLQRSFQRYMFRRDLAGSGRLIEVGYGGGQGLNLFLNISKEIIGYDIDEKNIEILFLDYFGGIHPGGLKIFKEDKKQNNPRGKKGYNLNKINSKYFSHYLGMVMRKK